MKYLIAGGTGFIGSHLSAHLSRGRHDIVLLTRSSSRTAVLNSASVRYVHWDPYASGEWMKEVDGADIVINLIGKNVFENRWNEKVKKEILDSRVIPTRLIVQAISAAVRKPSLMISASAVGYYGDRQDETITEESAPGNDFLADVVNQWEGAAYEAERFGVRVATPRIGLVLEKSGGMIGKMLLPFQLFAGGPIGSGKQYLPWVHMEDVMRGILYPAENTIFRGVYNLVSPLPITMNEFAKKFGAVLHRPSWIPVPSFALTLLYGEGGAVILSGQRALPKRLLESGYVFSYTDLSAALRNIVK
jgi:uncharacterized protein (TIGR01777 family)